MEEITGDERIRILIVDDDHVDKQLFAEGLAVLPSSYILRSASDIDQLFALLAQPPLPHVIFLDINLPKLDGFYGLQTLKSHPVYCTVPVVMFSVSDNEKDIEASYVGGAHYYMIKPYSIMNLRQSIKKIMSINWTISQPIPDRHHFVINEAFVLPSDSSQFTTEK
jgi:CheY-like chemotaxis protein